MKVGDLVMVQPFDKNSYIVVGVRDYGECDAMGKLWLLYSENIGIQPMYEKWIEVITGAEV